MRRPIAIAALCTVLVTAAPATADPLPAKWVAAAMCIHKHESLDWKLGGSSRYRGGMQFDVRTWATYAPPTFPRDPAAASQHQQLVVAYVVWFANGRRFGGSAWPAAAAACGVA
jgi:hypothetical protein